MSTTTNTGESAGVNVHTWLADNKLTDAEQAFVEREIQVEELTEFNQKELDDFAKDLGLDTLQRKRFVKAVAELQTNTISQAPSSSSTSFHTSYQPRATGSTFSSTTGSSGRRGEKKEGLVHVMVSPAEHSAITKLYSRFDKTSLLLQQLEQSVQQLMGAKSECQRDVDLKMQHIAAMLEEKRRELLNGIEALRAQKELTLRSQLDTLHQYRRAIADGKSKYEEFIGNTELEANKRKHDIVRMTEAIMNPKGVNLRMATQPKMQFSYQPPMLESFFAKVEIDDCDQPHAPIVTISKVTFNSLLIEFKISDPESARKVISFGIEYAKYKAKSPKKHKKKRKSKKKKKKKKKGKKKRKYSSDDSDSDSDSSSSDSSSDSSDSDSDSSSSDSDSSDSDSDSSDSGSDSDSDSDSDSGSESGSSSDSDSSSRKKKKKKGKKGKGKKHKAVDEAEEDFKAGPEMMQPPPPPPKAGAVAASASSEERVAPEDEADDEASKDFGDLSKLKWKEADVIRAKKGRYQVKAGVWEYRIDDLADTMAYLVRVRGKNKSGWGLYSTPSLGITKKLSIDSNIMRSKEKAALLSFMTRKDRKKRWKLIFRATRDGFQSTQFHARCDNKGRTVTVVNSTMGHVFGGYTSLPWQSGGGSYHQDPTAFIFLLRSSQKMYRKPRKWPINNASNAVYHSSSYGPTFGSGFDFYLCNGCNTTNSSYSNAGTAYGCPKDKTLLAGAYNFTVKEYEVWQLK